MSLKLDKMRKQKWVIRVATLIIDTKITAFYTTDIFIPGEIIEY